LFFAKWVYEIGDEIFFGGAGFEGLFFVFDDDLVVGDFDNLLTRNDQGGVIETFDKRAFDDDLADGIIVGRNGEVEDVSES